MASTPVPDGAPRSIAQPPISNAEVTSCPLVGLSMLINPSLTGAVTVMAKATNTRGSTQTFDLIFNPAGYHNNVVQRINLQVA